MIDLLFQTGLSNVCISLALALLAVLAEVKARRPQLAHLLWVLFFVKLLTPAVVTVPVDILPVQPASAVTATAYGGEQGPAAMDGGLSPAAYQLALEPAWGQALVADAAVMFNAAKPSLAAIWLLGSVLVMVFTLSRVCRFNRLLRRETQVAPAELQGVAVRIAHLLGMHAAPAVHITSAQMSPLVWWIGGRVRIVIPDILLNRMETGKLHWILAHELAHVRRRDYMVRWVEWLACVLFWWNPLCWWARRRLRANEELCCDAMVLQSLNPEPHTYADSLLTAIEHLARPVIRPPAIASEINSGGFLERRLNMIVSKPIMKNSRWLVLGVALVALAVLPLCFAFGCGGGAEAKAAAKDSETAAGQSDGTSEARDAKLEPGAKADEDIEWDEAVRKIEAAFEAGKLTREQADKKLEYLRQQMAGKDGGRDSEKDIEWEEAARKIEAAFEDGKLTREQADKKLEYLRHQMAGKDGGRDSEKDIEWEEAARKIEVAFEAGKLTREQADKKLEYLRQQMAGKDGGHESGVVDHYLQLGIPAEKIKGLQASLIDSGIAEDLVEPVMAGILKVAYHIKDEGDGAALTPPLEKYLTERLGLTGAQLKLVVEFAGSIAAWIKLR